MKWREYFFFESAIKNGNWKGHLLLALTFSIIISLSGCESCEEDINPPGITTLPVSEITANNAKGGGRVNDAGGGTIKSRGLVWDLNHNPTIGNCAGSTNEGSGLGTFSCALTDLSHGTTYYVRAYASNEAGPGYGNEVAFLTLLKDVEGNTYKVVKIGDQIWMAENLRTTIDNEGTAIQLVTGNSAWAGLSTPAYCWHGNDKSKNAAAYGALYNWRTVRNGKLCPAGWHVPSDAEWTVLIDELGGSELAGGKMKATGTLEAGTGLWLKPNTGATNISGFTAVPGGSRYYLEGTFLHMGSYGYWWSFTPNTPWAWTLHFDNAHVGRNNFNVGDGFSVRCIRD